MTPQRLQEIERALAVANKVVRGPTMAGELLEEVHRLRELIRLHRQQCWGGQEDEAVDASWPPDAALYRSALGEDA